MKKFILAVTLLNFVSFAEAGEEYIPESNGQPSHKTESGYSGSNTQKRQNDSRQTPSVGKQLPKTESGYNSFERQDPSVSDADRGIQKDLQDSHEKSHKSPSSSEQ